VIVLGLLAGCGRLSFDSQSADGNTNSPIDAIAIDAPMFATCLQVGSDGLLCDDRNICTPESRCQAGACVATLPMATCTVANSEVDFETTQGEKGWWYGYYQPDGVYDPAVDFTLAEYDAADSGYETPSATFTYLAWWGAHPDSDPVEFAVRRWVSNVHGPTQIEVRYGKSDVGCGDGTEIRMVVDGVQLGSWELAFDDGPGSTVYVTPDVTLGTLVEMHLGPRGATDSCDSTETAFIVRSPP
jgi:hypothetical protein